MYCRDDYCDDFILHYSTPGGSVDIHHPNDPFVTPPVFGPTKLYGFGSLIGFSYTWGYALMCCMCISVFVYVLCICIYVCRYKTVD